MEWCLLRRPRVGCIKRRSFPAFQVAHRTITYCCVTILNVVTVCSSCIKDFVRLPLLRSCSLCRRLVGVSCRVFKVHWLTIWSRRKSILQRAIRCTWLEDMRYILPIHFGRPSLRGMTFDWRYCSRGRVRVLRHLISNQPTWRLGRAIRLSRTKIWKWRLRRRIRCWSTCHTSGWSPRCAPVIVANF